MKNKTTETKLRPTFWRTCRAVMNETRLRLLKAVVESQGKACVVKLAKAVGIDESCLLYTSPSPRDQRGSRMPSSA